MKKIIGAFLVIALLGGCSTLQRDYAIVTGAKVSSQKIIIAANAFDALQITATNYLIYCKKNPTVKICVPENIEDTIKAVRSGRAARNSLELNVVSGAAGPVDIYNALTAAITSLQSTPVVSAGASK